MDDENEPAPLPHPSFGLFFDPGPVEEPVRSDHETEVSVGKTHGDPSALLKRGVGHLDGAPSSAHHSKVKLCIFRGCHRSKSEMYYLRLLKD